MMVHSETFLAIDSTEKGIIRLSQNVNNYTWKRSEHANDDETRFHDVRRVNDERSVQGGSECFRIHYTETSGYLGRDNNNHNNNNNDRKR